MSTFTLAISFDHFQFALIHIPDIPGSYAVLVFIALDLTSITSHIHNWVLFLLWLHPFILSGVISLLISSSILGPYRLGEFPFSILSFCLFILFTGFSRQEYWSGLPFPSPVDHILSDLSTLPICLGWPHMAWLTFIELDKAVVCVIRLAIFLWLWFQCFCPLMPSRNTYLLTWVSLTLDVGYLFTAAPAKCSCCFLPWTRGISSQPRLLTLNME